MVGGPAIYPKSGGILKDCVDGNLTHESILEMNFMSEIRYFTLCT